MKSIPLDISLFQGETIYALYNQTGLVRNLDGYNNSIMFNRIKLTNKSQKNINIKSCEFSFFANNKIIQRSHYDEDRIRSEASQAFNYVTHPMVKEYYQDVPYFKEEATKDTNIPPEQSLFIFGQYFEFYSPSKIDRVEITCKDSESNAYEKNIIIAEYKTKRNYILPMKGQFVITGGPYEIWGHRTKHPEEFGIDLQVVDNNLKPYRDDPFNENNHYCFGMDVMAPADGKIIFSEDGVIDNQIPYDSQNNNKVFIENRKDFSFFHAAGGNYIIINHGNEEYSFLTHLMKGSIKVKAGDQVKQSQIIAKCGNSGEGSTAPHLHYHLMNGPIMAQARGLPIDFQNVQNSVFNNNSLSKMKLPEPIKNVFKDINFSLWSTLD